MSLQGQSTGTQPERNPNTGLGLHEPVQWYDICKARTRNKGNVHAEHNFATSPYVERLMR